MSSSNNPVSQQSRKAQGEVQELQTVPQEDQLVNFHDPFDFSLGPMTALAIMPSLGAALSAMPRAEMIRMDFHESPNSYELIADLPGVLKSNIQIQLEGRVLHISTTKSTFDESDDTRGGWTTHRIERNSSYAHRSLRLPANADLNKLDAKADNGVLHIRIDKIPQQQATQSRRAITVL